MNRAGVNRIAQIRYRYPAQHFGLAPYFWERTMVGVPLFRLVYPSGKVKAELKNAVFLGWSPDGSQVLCRSTRPGPRRRPMLHVIATTRLGKDDGLALCEAPAWVSWHPTGALIAWCNTGGCRMADLTTKRSVRVTGTVGESWCQWAPTPAGSPPRLLYVDADHLQLVEETGRVAAHAPSPLSPSGPAGEAPARSAAKRQPVQFGTRPPPLVWSPTGERFALSDGEQVSVFRLATLERLAGVARAFAERNGGPVTPSPGQPEAPVLVGWTAAPAPA